MISFLKKSLSKRKRSILVTLVVSYVVIYLLPILTIMITAYTVIFDAVETEITNAATDKMLVLQHDIERICTDAGTIAQSVELDKAVNEFGRLKQFTLNDTDYVFTRMNAIQQLTDIVKIHDEIYSVEFYNSFDNSVIRGGNTQADTNANYGEYYRQGVTAPFWRVNVNEDGQNIITYYYPTSAYLTDMRGIVGVNIRQTTFEKRILLSDSSDHVKFAIIDGDGNFIFSSFPSGEHEKLVQQYQRITNEGGAGYFTSGQGDKRNFTIFSKSSASGWVLIHESSFEMLMQKLLFLKTIFYIVVFGLILLGGPFIYILSRHYYNPIYNIARNINRIWPEVSDNKNEFEFFDNALEVISKTEETYKEELMEARVKTAENYIHQILNGSVPKENDTGMLLHKYFIAVVFEIDGYTSFLQEFHSERQREIKNIIRERVKAALTGEERECISLAGGKHTLFVMNTDSNEDAGFLDIEALCRTVREQIAQETGVSLTVGIGDIYEDIANIRSSYLDAIRAVHLSIIRKRGTVYTVRDELLTQNSCYYYPEMEEKHILNYLGLGLKEPIGECIDKIIDNIRNTENISYENIVMIFNQMLSNTHKYLLDLRIDAGKIFSYDRYEVLISKETLEEMGAFMLETYSEIIDYRESHSLSNLSSKKHIVLIKDYLNKNYRKDISIHDVSAHVGISYSHVRRIFQEETGETILSYLNRLRIVKAKEFLKQTDKSIGEIAEIVGYNSDRTLTRVFKKTEGITPGKYREIEKGTSNFVF